MKNGIELLKELIEDPFDHIQSMTVYLLAVRAGNWVWAWTSSRGGVLLFVVDVPASSLAAPLPAPPLPGTGPVMSAVPTLAIASRPVGSASAAGELFA
jgi:hypothetical protein